MIRPKDTNKSLRKTWKYVGYCTNGIRCTIKDDDDHWHIHRSMEKIHILTDRKATSSIYSDGFFHGIKKWRYDRGFTCCLFNGGHGDFPKKHKKNTGIFEMKDQLNDYLDMMETN
jgi:hypothetical protein